MAKNRIKFTPGFILGPLIFNENTLDMLCEQKDVKLTVSADDNTIYFCYIKVLLNKLQLYLNGSQITI